MEYTRLVYRSPRLVREYPLLLSAAICEILPALLLLTNLLTLLNEENFPPRTGDNVWCLAQLVIHRFIFDREELARVAEDCDAALPVENSAKALR
jgi:hypothetical protein